MAAYAQTTTLVQQRVARMGDTVGMAILAGTVNVTNYNSTNAAITEITGKFKTVLSVVSGISDNGHSFQWTGTSFKVFTGDNDAVANGPSVEAADDVDAGEVNFIAFGLI